MKTLSRIRARALGGTRIRTAMLVAACAATTLTLLTSPAAHAEPTPSPTATAPASGSTSTPTPQELEDLQDFLEEQNEKLSKSAQAALMDTAAEDLRKQLPDEGGILGVFNVTDVNGLPISVYTVQSDTGSFMRWDLGMMNFLTEGLYMVTKWLIAFCCWLIGWSLSFGLAKLLLSPALAIANSVHTRIVMELGLPSVFLAVMTLLCTAHIFFGDRAKGWGDAALSIVLAALTTTVLTSTPQFLLGQDNGAIAAARGFSLEAADIILDADPTTPWSTNDITTPATSYTLSRPLTDALTDAFIVKPAMLLQYGQVFEGACAAKYGEKRIEQLVYDRQIDAIVKKGTTLNNLMPDTIGTAITVDGAAARWVFNHYGGPPMDDFEKACVKGDTNAAKKASLDKLGGSLFLLAAAMIVSVLISGLASSFLIAQCRIAWDAIRGEPALIVGTIPGPGRAFLWDWVASIWRNLAAMLISVISLAAFIIILKAALDPAQTDWGNELTLRFLAVDVLCIAAVKKRKTLQTRTHQMANHLKTKLSHSRIGGTHGSIFTPGTTPALAASHLGRKTTRGLIRGTLVTTALATGNPALALAYSMPRSLGATTLINRISRGRGGTSRPRNARPSRRPSPQPAPTSTPGTATGPAPHTPALPTPPSTAPPRPHSPPRPTGRPQPAPPPRPSNRPGSYTARPVGTRPATSTTRRPRHPVPTQPPQSASQQQLRRRLDRGIRRTPPSPRRSLNPNRSNRDEYEAHLTGLEEAELARRTDGTTGDA
ncbi:hypothetical protein ACIPSE_46930 [Streptomyces sp. NPDC090106]|uniref:hypothetical protein n=1 Tax=Streptomyces sp. NPDC090106 TaxID=3365946 RepID=UPI00380F9B10